MTEENVQRVLIVGDGSLLDEGLRRLLAGKEFLEVANITYTDEATLRDHIFTLKPDTIVLYEGGPLSVNRVFELGADIPGLKRLRVITILVDSNAVDVVERRQVVAVGSADLLTLLRRPVTSRTAM
jgi:hypothetical protein